MIDKKLYVLEMKLSEVSFCVVCPQGMKKKMYS